MPSRQGMYKSKTYSADRAFRTGLVKGYRRRRKAPISSRYRRMKTEVKSVDQPLTVSPIRAGSLATTITCVNFPVDGIGFYQRIGNEISMKSLYLNGEIELNGTNAAANSGEYARIMVIYDKQTNNAAPVYTDILTAYNAAGATSSSSYDGLNQNNRKRFKILMDERINLPGTGVGGVTGINTNQETEMNSTKMNISRYIKLNGLPTCFSASAGNVTDITTGGLFVFVIGTTTVANQVAYVFNWSARLRYWDK